MGTYSLVSMIAWALLAALTACVDGGPPSPFKRPGMRNTPALAADSGSTADTDTQDEDDAGADAQHSETSVRDPGET